MQNASQAQLQIVSSSSWFRVSLELCISFSLCSAFFFFFFRFFSPPSFLALRYYSRCLWASLFSLGAFLLGPLSFSSHWLLWSASRLCSGVHSSLNSHCISWTPLSSVFVTRSRRNLGKSMGSKFSWPLEIQCLIDIN